MQRRLQNLLEELAIAARVAVPRAFVLEDEPSINALTAGMDRNQAVVMVTRGALARLTRDELQGVLAHEVSHIVNGDVRLNTRLVGLNHGLEMVATMGRAMLARAVGPLRGRSVTGPLAVLAIVPLVLLGSSGAGKSTLTNALIGRAVQDTGAVRADDSRGRHTTTTRSLHRLPGGACVIDTPGLRGLAPDIDEAGLAASFEDIRSLASQCRFRDCTHADEPDCAVRAGVAPDRLANYQKLLRDIRRDTLTPLQKREMVSLWKARGKAAAARMKMKRG